MRIAAGQLRDLDHETLLFARQLGAAGIHLNTPHIPGAGYWEVSELLRLRARCEAYGLRLEAIENTPVSFYDRAMLGLPGRDEQIERYCLTIRNLGSAGIPFLGYHWMPNGVWRTSQITPSRGGAQVSSFDLSHAQADVLTHGRVFGEAEMWQNYAYFLRAVVPVAEEAGVKLALHPDDPPVAALGGVARIFRDFSSFDRALETVPSPNHGLDFCMGCWSEMGVDVVSAIRHFGRRNAIFYVHFRDVQGHVPCFDECFLGEGNVPVFAALQALKEVGFSGFIIDDHVPRMVDDSEWGHRGRAYAMGFIAGLLEALRATD